MSQKEKYDYMKDLVNDKAQEADGKNGWKSKDGQWNIIGIRGFEDGKVNKNKADKYNDTIILARMKDGKPQVREFDASVDAGKWTKKEAETDHYGYYDKGKNKGIVHLADGFYRDTWIRGTVPGDERGLRQNRNIRVNADSNFDGTIQNRERLGKDNDHDGKKDGMVSGPSTGIQFHRGGYGKEVGHSSAGCQVIHGDQYDTFKRLLYDDPAQSGYSYLLIDGDDLPGAR
jgi:hypothetical protein